MIHYNQHPECVQCEIDIDAKVFSYSTQIFGHPLCRKCQDWFRDILEYSTATNESINLYFALRQRGVPAQLEKSDGFKTIDIAVPQAKVNIEVDGGHHNYNAGQAMSDLKRTLYSYKRGYSTLRIPNSLAKHDLDEAADLITEYLIESRQRRKKRY
jgi:very-short-patch-repair endonuclease